MRKCILIISNPSMGFCSKYFNDNSGDIMIKDEIDLRFNKTSQVKFLNDCILNGMKNGIKTFKISIQDKGTFSNVCAPIAGVLNFYQTKGIKFEFEHSIDSYFEHTHTLNPLCVFSDKGKLNLKNPFDKVWMFKDSCEVNALVDSFLFCLRQSIKLSEGIIFSIEWCINEVMDNVLQHSGIECGYIMGQIHPKTQRLSFCIFDAGVGIYNSFRQSGNVLPSSPFDAITLALQEKITRDNNIGQGNGLWGLSNIVKQSSGMLRVSSNGATYINDNGNEKVIKRGDFNLGKYGTTNIDFQLDYSKGIDVAKALKYEQTDLWLESIEDERDENRVNIIVSDIANGTGTRKSAEKLRTLVMNIVNVDHKKVTLDFSGVNFISSSFADELIGKIIKEKGFVFFIQVFTIIGLNPLLANVINRSVEQRMAQMYYDHKFEELEND